MQQNTFDNLTVAKLVKKYTPAMEYKCLLLCP
jgi:hypothetical protein